MRIAVLHFSHETVTFLANDTTLADFTYPGSPAKGDAVLAMQPRDYIGGFVQVAREYADVERSSNPPLTASTEHARITQQLTNTT